MQAPIGREVLYHRDVRLGTIPESGMDAGKLIRNAHSFPFVDPLFENLAGHPVGKRYLLHAEYFESWRVQHLLYSAGRGFENGEGNHLVESH